MSHTSRVVLLFCFSILFFSHNHAQTPAPSPSDKPARTNIDESFYLNIIDRRLTEENFKVGTSVTTEPESGVDVQVGVGLSASRIDVHMRNIRGTVRFHGSPDRILRILRPRPAPTVPDSP